LFNVDTGDFTRLNVTADRGVSFSPDDSQLVFSMHGQLAIYTLSSGAITLLPPTSIAYPEWRRNP
jgi:hypothetical protein